MLLKKEVGVLEKKVNTLKNSVQGAAASLLAIGSPEEGLKSQVADLEMRVGELLSTTATLETEVHGLSSETEVHGFSSENGLSSETATLETEVQGLSSETEVQGLSSETEESLLQKEVPDGKRGLVPRVSVLKDTVSSLKSRVFTLEHHV